MEFSQLVLLVGPHSWPLSAMEMEYPPGLQRYRLFALFLLQGKVRVERGRKGKGELSWLLWLQVCRQLAQFSTALLLPPVTMVKSWAKYVSPSLPCPHIHLLTILCRLHPQTEVLLRALVDREVCSRQALMKQWMTDSTCERLWQTWKECCSY